MVSKDVSGSFKTYRLGSINFTVLSEDINLFKG